MKRHSLLLAKHEVCEYRSWMIHGVQFKVCLCGAMRSVFFVYQSNTLRRVFAPRLCHSGQTHRFKHCLSAAAGALEYPKKNSRSGNKKDLYFNFLLYFIKSYINMYGWLLGSGFNCKADSSTLAGLRRTTYMFWL